MAGKRLTKAPEVIAWEEWRDSQEGKMCRANPAEGPYLENRLWRAFMSGIKAGAALEDKRP